MSVVKFTCSHCQRLMAVGPDLFGRSVRCPHCQGIVVAPTFATVAPNGPAVAGGDFQFDQSRHESGGPIPATPVTEQPQWAVPATDSNTANLSFGTPDAKPEQAASSQPAHRHREPTASSGPGWLVPILAPYAVFITVVAVFYYVKYSSATQEHPLEQIPDLLGEFQQKQTKSTSQSKRLPKPDQDLPDKLMTFLGRPLSVGAIELTPLSIEYRPWTAYVKEKGRPDPVKRPIGKTLVLRVRLRNLSGDLAFYPTDPYFDRRPKDATEKPYTLVDVGGEKFFGGVMQYITESGSTERAWLEEREKDDQPLGPGESRETVLLTYPKNNVFDAVRKSGGRAVWRVHVRRGMVPYHGTEIPASAVVGVVFTAADVKQSG